MAGTFITFEGGEGTGKTTQAWSLAERLEAAGQSVVLTREPGGAPSGAPIRKLLVEGDPERWSVAAETLLFFADRDVHINEIVRPSLEAGKWVICDRFTDSTRAYQGARAPELIELIDLLDRTIVGKLSPDLTLVMDIDPGVGLKRAAGRTKQGAGEDRFERKQEAYHVHVRQAFLDIAKSAPERCVVLDTDRTTRAIEEDIWRIVQKRFLQA